MAVTTRQRRAINAINGSKESVQKALSEVASGPLTPESVASVGAVSGTTGTFTGALASAGLVSTAAIAGPRTVISGQGAGPIILTAAQSGALCLFDRAAGIIYTLPAPVVGLWFEFHTTVTITTNAAKVITNAGTVFLGGSYVEYDVDTSRATALRTGNGTTNIAISSNGSTTGGILGSRYRVDCVSATLWIVTGVMEATGAVATAFSDT